MSCVLFFFLKYIFYWLMYVAVFVPGILLFVSRHFPVVLDVYLTFDVVAVYILQPQAQLKLTNTEAL